MPTSASQPGSLPVNGLIEQVTPRRCGLSSSCPELTRRVVEFITSCRQHGSDKLPFREAPAPDAVANIETLTWALVSARHVHCDDLVEPVRQEIVAEYNRHYDSALQIFQQGDHQRGRPIGSWHLHNDSVVRDGLRLLGETEPPRPTGVERLRDFPWALQPGQPVRVWLDACWVHGARRGAKEIYQGLLLYLRVAGITHFDDFDDTAKTMLQYLEAKRDPASGFIGVDPTDRLGWAMRGYRNMVLGLYWPMGIPEPDLPRLIDATLACQRTDALFDDGSMCANMDAVHLLAEYGLRTDHRQKEIIDACRRCVASIFKTLSHASGGFHFVMPNTGSETQQQMLMTGTSFTLETIRYWQAIDPEARADLKHALETARRTSSG